VPTSPTTKYLSRRRIAAAGIAVLQQRDQKRARSTFFRVSHSLARLSQPSLTFSPPCGSCRHIRKAPTKWTHHAQTLTPAPTLNHPIRRAKFSFPTLVTRCITYLFYSPSIAVLLTPPSHRRFRENALTLPPILACSPASSTDFSDLALHQAANTRFRIKAVKGGASCSDAMTNQGLFLFLTLSNDLLSTLTSHTQAVSRPNSNPMWPTMTHTNPHYATDNCGGRI